MFNEQNTKKVIAHEKIFLFGRKTVHFSTGKPLFNRKKCALFEHEHALFLSLKVTLLITRLSGAKRLVVT